jgi:hypothetical protein
MSYSKNKLAVIKYCSVLEEKEDRKQLRDLQLTMQLRSTIASKILSVHTKQRNEHDLLSFFLHAE